ncbi:GNAT family N-acetyltransferase [Labrenzia sp. PHM005]|uniref:GNAT family N-acetyltransferase n=1 Tax=Labrenzia sp. PHM005 TaxID=2590016 RepID=UPI00113FEA4F|nr:GNAT family N-acetyltransferase [Labrenzia sp. PHM005]QDG75117.1 GNAT family N-acetyltransferase [Labrenzia sp. PHM005]
MNTQRISYRRSNADDTQAVYNLVMASVRRLAPVPYSQEVIDTWMEGRRVEDYQPDCAQGLVWLAEAGDRPVGFSQGEPGAVKRLFVDADFVGLGIGADLMERALKDALSGNMKTIVIEATLNAVPFYKKWGFVEVNEGIFPGREGLPPIRIVRLTACFN